jgi:hypothetical protein
MAGKLEYIYPHDDIGLTLHSLGSPFFGPVAQFQLHYHGFEQAQIHALEFKKTSFFPCFSIFHAWICDKANP